MKSRHLHSSFIASLVVLAVVLLKPEPKARAENTLSSSSVPARTFEFTYQVHVGGMPSAGPIRLWIPLPQSDSHQDIQDLHIVSGVRYKLGQERKYGNRFAYFEPDPIRAAAGFEVLLKFIVTRREHRVFLSRGRPRADKLDKEFARFLQPDRLVPLDGVITDLARQQTSGAATPLEKARRIFEFVIASMRYDKSGQGWGRGDAIWACTAKRGNCTDFHALFIGLMRASGIPARFEIGFPLPEDKHEGVIPGYHCWAEFYLDGVGWVPVDASEAWKNPTKHDYFFGAHDDNRVFFTAGRDIHLSPEQKGEPLNYFIYPYLEGNGNAVPPLESHFSFRDLHVPGNAAAR